MVNVFGKILGKETRGSKKKMSKRRLYIILFSGSKIIINMHYGT